MTLLKKSCSLPNIRVVCHQGGQEVDQVVGADANAVEQAVAKLAEGWPDQQNLQSAPQQSWDHFSYGDVDYLLSGLESRGAICRPESLSPMVQEENMALLELAVLAVAARLHLNVSQNVRRSRVIMQLFQLLPSSCYSTTLKHINLPFKPTPDEVNKLHESH